MRISAGWVIVTIFDRNSLKNRLRELSRRYSGKRSKHTFARADLADGVAEISLAVAPERRGQGLGSAMLRQAPGSVGAAWGDVRLRARVFADNAPSLRMFRRCGFREVDTHEAAGAEVIVFELAGDRRQR